MDMARFKIGDRVRILTVSPTPFAGLEGAVDEVHPNDRGVTALDRYTVIFDWKEKRPFFDVQLAEAAKQARTGNEID